MTRKVRGSPEPKTQKQPLHQLPPMPDASALIVHLYKPTARECALLTLQLWRLKEAEMGKEFTRLRISEITLRRLWCRNRLSPDLIERVNEWLGNAGVALFDAGTTYGLIETSAVESWTRTTSKRLSTDLEEVAKGTYDFTKLEHLFAQPREEEGDSD